MTILNILLLSALATIASSQIETPIYGRDYVLAQPVRRVEPSERIETRNSILDLLLGRAICSGSNVLCPTTGTCCSVIYDTCCSDGTCNTFLDHCCLGGGSCYSFEQCCGPYRCAGADAECCDDGNTHCNVGSCYRVNGVMQCCISSICHDPSLDLLGKGAPPGLDLGTVTPAPPVTTKAAPTPIVVTQYYYTYITWYYYSYYFTIIFNPPTTTTASARITVSSYVSAKATDSNDAAQQFSSISVAIATTPPEAISPARTSGTPIPTKESTTPPVNSPLSSNKEGANSGPSSNTVRESGVTVTVTAPGVANGTTSRTSSTTTIATGPFTATAVAGSNVKNPGSTVRCWRISELTTIISVIMMINGMY